MSDTNAAQPDAETTGENDVDENSGVTGDAGNIDALAVPEAVDD